MARPERFELPTFWFVARRSIQLSYGRFLRAAHVSTTCPECHPARGYGGERGIRTLDGLLTHTPLAGARLRPLGHLSGRAQGPNRERGIIPAPSSLGKAEG